MAGAGVLAVGLVLADTAPDPDEVTPGLLGFVVTFALALALLVLIRSFIKHLRRAQNAEQRLADEQLLAERAASGGRPAGGPVKAGSGDVIRVPDAADAPVADPPVADAPVADPPVADAPVADVPASTKERREEA
ncbi:MAG TPA: hypothetical protein DHV14_01340 [Micrococcales bacterium]|uniref:hypothetical protein n=1 Tax=Miniimonas arenae TaxID=676201 RepID=UPI000EF0E7C7|nr:hypothetical protein [Miniimonas arenae]HCX83786.1 hypothetical protein [Micrococcales bacterium]